MTGIERRQLLQSVGAAGLVLGAGGARGNRDIRSSQVPEPIPFTATAATGRVGLDIETVGDASVFSASDVAGPPPAEVAGVVQSGAVWKPGDNVRPFSVNVSALLVALGPNRVRDTLVDRYVATGGLRDVLAGTSLDEVLGVLTGLIDDLNISPALATELLDVVEGFVGFDPRLLEQPPIEAVEDTAALLSDPNPADYESVLAVLEEVGSVLSGGVETQQSGDITLESALLSLVGLVGFDTVETIPDLETELATRIGSIDVRGALVGSPLVAEVQPPRGVFDPRVGGDARVTATVESFRLDLLELALPLVSGIRGSRPERIRATSEAPPTAVEVPLGLELTSGESNPDDSSGTGLTGDVTVAADGESATVTLVNNEFVAGLEGFTIVAAARELQGPIDALIAQLDGLADGGLEALLAGLLDKMLSVDGESLAAELAPFLESLELAAVLEGNLDEPPFDADAFVRTLFPDEPGDHALEFEFTFDFAEAVDLDPNGEQPFDLPSVVDDTVQEPPLAFTDDGLFGDVNGDGVVDIADVQALFELRGDINRADEGRFYNFSGVQTDRVNVFDVQALFYFVS